MKELLTIALFLVILNSCKNKESGTQNQVIIPVSSGSCNIGKWSSQALPLSLKISPDLVNDFTNTGLNSINSISQMAQVWNNAIPEVPLFNMSASTLETASQNGSSSLSAYRDSEFGIYKSDTWFSNVSSSALAITQYFGTVKSDGSLGTYVDLTHADIILNYYNYSSEFTFDGNSFLDYDVPTIVLHEIGHFLGLCHESNSTSIMAPYYLTTQRSLKTFDTSKIRALYLNNQNYNVNAINARMTNSISAPIGSTVRGIIELNANGICKHYINGKFTYQHIQQ